MVAKKKDLAQTIIQRANASGLSISRLCREAGVSRRWFEDFKRRPPRSILLFLRLDAKLKEYETQNIE